MRKTFATYTFGCRVNQAETERIASSLLAQGFHEDVENPSVFLINTCAVTKKAEREARQRIYLIRRTHPHTSIVVTGCAATKWMRDDGCVDGVDLIIENSKKEEAGEIISQRINNSKVKTQSFDFAQDKHSKAQGKIKKHDGILAQRKNGAIEQSNNEAISFSSNKFLNSGRLLLKIQDGCQRFCTFCIVPYLRGRPKSMSIKYLVSSIKYREEELREVVLTAINTEAYGLDTNESLIGLVENIVENTSVPRISFGSIHPWSINQEFLAMYKRLVPQQRLVDFFHIPLQSGSNKILQLMRRGYTSDAFLESLHTIHTINPTAFIGTDIITGFLEETDQDFKDTYAFLEKSPIAKLHVFRFSPREKTVAFFMAKKMNHPTASEKIKRAHALISLGKKKYESFLNAHIGKVFPALFLPQTKNGHTLALLSNQIPAYVKGVKHETGRITNVRIRECAGPTVLAQYA